MKQFDETIGVDVSKSTLDAYVHRTNVHCQFENNQKGYSAMLKWISQLKLNKEKVLWCFEHTGIYSTPLAAFLEERDMAFSMVPALEIKRSLGMVRGKNDKVDARRIAEYAYLRRDRLKLTVLPSLTMQKLKELLGVRDRMVQQRAGYIRCLKELKVFFNKSHNEELFSTQENMIKALDKNILVVENKINDLIQEETEIKEMFKLVTSVKGIGPVVGTYLIVVTNCFTAFESSRKFACYCGIAPFEKQSGTSLKSRSKVSHYADKKMKALLDRAASSAIQHDAELSHYYQRRVAEGKSKMSTLNIVRNKILHRVFAVVKRATPYVEIQKWAA